MTDNPLAGISQSSPLLLIGGGKMGSALLRGWLKAGLSPEAVLVVEPHSESRESLTSLGVTLVAGAEDIPQSLKPHLLVIAVKPQMLDQVLPQYATISAQSLVFSIVAGKSLRHFRNCLGEARGIIRAIPNTPASIGAGLTALVADPETSAGDKALAEALAKAVGEFLWLEREELIDAATAISGSGPAYLFYLIETLSSAAEKLGFKTEDADRLALATVAGAGALAAQSELSPRELRRQVTSPNGTTEAALNILMAEEGLAPLIRQAAKAAYARARELGREE